MPLDDVKTTEYHAERQRRISRAALERATGNYRELGRRFRAANTKEIELLLDRLLAEAWPRRK